MADIDHEYTDNITCPHCGLQVIEPYEYEGALTEEETRIECDECGETFASYCNLSYSFTTHKVDLEAEKRRHQERRRNDQERMNQARAEASKWPPGTRVRVRVNTRYANHIRGRTGSVPNKELGHHGHVKVTLDPTPEHKSYETSFDPKDLEPLTGT